MNEDISVKNTINAREENMARIVAIAYMVNRMDFASVLKYKHLVIEIFVNFPRIKSLDWHH